MPTYCWPNQPACNRKLCIYYNIYIYTCVYLRIHLPYIYTCSFYIYVSFLQTTCRINSINSRKALALLALSISFVSIYESTCQYHSINTHIHIHIHHHSSTSKSLDWFSISKLSRSYNIGVFCKWIFNIGWFPHCHPIRWNHLIPWKPIYRIPWCSHQISSKKISLVSSLYP